MQGDDSKEGKDSKRLSRAELLEMLIEQSKEVESLKKKVDELQKQLDDRTIQLQQTGSIAEAALALNDIFKAADQAASQYIESIKRMEHEKNVEFQALRQKTLDACAVMREDTQITDGITAPDGQSLKFMPDFEDCGYKTDVKTAKELVALSRRLKIWIDEKDIQPTYTLATDVTGRCSISSVPFGMYLIVPSSYDDYGPVVMSLVFLPGRDANGDLIYQNRIIPKHSIPEEDEPDGPTNPHESNSTTPEETSPEETTSDESTSSEEETTPSEPTSPAESTTPSESRTPEEESNPYQPTTPAAPTTPSQTTPTTAPQTTAPQTTAPQPTTPPESPRRILGIEDPTGRIGMMMVTAGVGLMAIAIVLIVRRELKK